MDSNSKLSETINRALAKHQQKRRRSLEAMARVKAAAAAAPRYAVIECGDEAWRRIISQAEVRTVNGLQCDIIGENLTRDQAVKLAGGAL